jgi:hypothetical protein
LPVAECFA